MVWWISTYDSSIAVAMFVITYISLLILVVRMMKGTILEPHLRQHHHELRQEGPRLEADRQRTKASVADTERAHLARGEVTPVLDVWQIDPALRTRHSFISQTSTCRIDPVAGEWQVRIHLPREWTLDTKSGQSVRLLREVAAYLRLLSADTFAIALKPFAATVIFEMYMVREDDGLYGTFVPVLSLTVPWSDLQRSSPNTRPPYLPGDLRFANGDAIEPHRSLPPGAGTATK